MNKKAELGFGTAFMIFLLLLTALSIKDKLSYIINHDKNLTEVHCYPPIVNGYGNTTYTVKIENGSCIYETKAETPPRS